MHQIQGGSANLCAHGKQLPELFILGAQKSATSSISWDLLGTGIQSASGTQQWKESHFFDTRMLWSNWGAGNLDEQLEVWLAELPKCHRSKGRSVLADFTPSYLRMVPLPEDATARGILPPLNLDTAGHPEPGRMNLPDVLNNFYGKDAGRVSYLVMLREPLARMQSAYYAAKACNFTCICKGCEAESFADALEDHLQAAEQRELSDWVWASMYAQQVEQWLEKIDPRQMIIVPYLQYVHGEKDNICRALSGRMGFLMDCDSRGAPAAHEWHSPHPPLSDDIPSQRLLARWSAFSQPEVDNLVSVLARAGQAGAVLVNYAGIPGDEAEVRLWLESSW